MNLRFYTLAVATALLCFGLGLVWLFVPQLLLNLWNVQISEPVALVGRRAGALFLGIGAMFYVARAAGPSPARAGLLWGLATGCIGLAILGLFELSVGRVSAGILVAVTTEVMLAAACCKVANANHEENEPNKSLEPTA